MSDFMAQRLHFQNQLLTLAKRLNMANLARLLAFANALITQQEGKQQQRAESMAKRREKMSANS